MISAKLVEGKSLKSCKLCDTFATTDLTEMLQHLSGHNEEVIDKLKQNPTVWKRVLKDETMV